MTMASNGGSRVGVLPPFIDTHSHTVMNSTSHLQRSAKENKWGIDVQICLFGIKLRQTDSNSGIWSKGNNNMLLLSGLNNRDVDSTRSLACKQFSTWSLLISTASHTCCRDLEKPWWLQVWLYYDREQSSESEGDTDKDSSAVYLIPYWIQLNQGSCCKP